MAAKGRSKTMTILIVIGILALIAAGFSLGSALTKKTYQQQIVEKQTEIDRLTAEIAAAKDLIVARNEEILKNEYKIRLLNNTISKRKIVISKKEQEMKDIKLPQTVEETASKLKESGLNPEVKCEGNDGN